MSLSNATTANTATTSAAPVVVVTKPPPAVAGPSSSNNQASTTTTTTTKEKVVGGGRSCLELAQEAERLCRTTRDHAGAVGLFHAALAVGTHDLAVLSAIYSQLGNAYFCQGDYDHALEFHRWDLSLSRKAGDLLGEAKACANLSICYKAIKKYPEAVVCAKRQLEICRGFNDKAAVARALYHLGSAYHAKGRKFVEFAGPNQLGEFTPEARQDQERALAYFQAYLALVCELGDRSAEGRAYGNLGNTHYLLGNYRETVEFFKKRLQIGKEFGDLRAQHRAYSNLGNAYIFLSEFESAARSYKHALGIARRLGDGALQAQACFSLGHSCTLLRDYSAAVVYYLRHLHAAWYAGDKLGECRCHWALANVYAALGDYQRALRSSLRQRKICKERNDEVGVLAADLMIGELQRILGSSQPEADAACQNSARLQSMAQTRALEQVMLLNADTTAATAAGGEEGCQRLLVAVSPLSQPSDSVVVDDDNDADAASPPAAVVAELSEAELSSELSLATTAAIAVRRQQSPQSPSDVLSLSDEEEEDFVLVVESSDQASLHHQQPQQEEAEKHSPSEGPPAETADQADSSEVLLDLLFKSQALRLNDQRCDMAAINGGGGEGLLAAAAAASGDSLNAEDESFLELLINLQGSRMNDQRADFPGLIETSGAGAPPSRGQQPAPLPPPPPLPPTVERRMENNSAAVANGVRVRSASDGLAEQSFVAAQEDEASTGGSAEGFSQGDDFFDFIFKLQQKTRINDQRATILPPNSLFTSNRSHTNTNHVSTNGNGEGGSDCQATANGSNGGGTPHRLLRVLSVPGGRKRRRRNCEGISHKAPANQ